MCRPQDRFASALRSRFAPAHYNGARMSLRELRRHAGRFAIVGFNGHSAPDDLRRLVAEFDLGGVIYFARNIVEPRAGAELSREVAALAPRLAALDQRRPGRRPRRPSEVAVHRMAASDHARPQRRRRAGGAVCARRSPPNCWPSASTSTTRRCSTCTRIRAIPSSATARCRTMAEDVGPARRGDRPGAAGRGSRGLRQTLSRPWRHERRFA